MVKATLPGGASDSRRSMMLFKAPSTQSRHAVRVSNSNEPCSGNVRHTGNENVEFPGRTNLSPLGICSQRLSRSTLRRANSTASNKCCGGVQSSQQAWFQSGNNASADSFASAIAAYNEGTVDCHSASTACHCSPRSLSTCSRRTACSSRNMAMRASLFLRNSSTSSRKVFSSASRRMQLRLSCLSRRRAAFASSARSRSAFNPGASSSKGTFHWRFSCATVVSYVVSTSVIRCR